jgi:hypothetical protein
LDAGRTVEVPDLILFLPFSVGYATALLLEAMPFRSVRFLQGVVLPITVFLLDCTLIPLLAEHLLHLCLCAPSAGTEAALVYAGRVERERWSPLVFLLLYAACAVAAEVPQILRATLRELRETRYLLSKTLLDREEA